MAFKYAHANSVDTITADMKSAWASIHYSVASTRNTAHPRILNRNTHVSANTIVITKCK